MLQNNLFEFNDLPLTQLTHTFAEGSIWLEEGMGDRTATFDLAIREMPKNRNFLVFAGLEEIVYYLNKMKFGDDHIQFLLKGKLITKKFANYLKKFKFSGDVWSIPEGTIFFPGEPVVRITAPLIEASLIEVFMFNMAVSNIGFLSKAARYKIVFDGKVLISVGMQRSQSFESGIKGLRNGYICDMVADAFPIFSKKFNLPQPKYIINGQHLFIKSFPDEITAFRKMTEYFAENASFMIDTYDFDQGLKNAIKVGLEMKAKGLSLRYVTIDAGDLSKLAYKARRELDKAGLKKIQIVAASNLDEHKIKKLIKQKSPIDYYVTATEYITLADSPKLEVVYKLAELRQGRNIQHCAKLTPGKESYPGRKQIFRKYKNGKIWQDTIGLSQEKNLGTPLLKQYMKSGKTIRKPANLLEIKKYFNKQFKTIPSKLLDIEKEYEFRPKISKKLQTLFGKVQKEHI